MVRIHVKSEHIANLLIKIHIESFPMGLHCQIIDQQITSQGVRTETIDLIHILLHRKSDDISTCLFSGDLILFLIRQKIAIFQVFFSILGEDNRIFAKSTSRLMQF